MESKGQMFLIGAVVIASALLILKVATRTPTSINELKNLKGGFEGDMFTNIVAEFNKTMDLSVYEGIGVTSNVYDFGNFTKDNMIEHSLDLKLVFVGLVANRTTGFMNISVVNLYGSSISATLTLNDSQSNTSSVADYGRWDTNFTFTAGKDYILTVTYDSTRNNMTIETKTNKDVYVGYFDISLESPSSIHRTKYQKSMIMK